MNFFCVDELPRSPWKNGGGTTREIMSWPPGADFASFDWRVSVATISAAGPFSRFAGIDRVIMLLAGDGVRLRGSKTDWLLDQVHQPFAFSGDEDLGCELLGAESTDFNVMTRRSIASARVETLDESRLVDALHGGVAMCLTGCWSVDDQLVTPGQGYWWGDVGMPIELVKKSSDRCSLVFVSWIRSKRFC